MIKVDAQNCSVEVQVEGSLVVLLTETLITMQTIFDNIQSRNPEAAEIFKETIEFAFEQDMVWNFCVGGNGE